jgi:hypothetical protein
VFLLILHVHVVREQPLGKVGENEYFWKNNFGKIMGTNTIISFILHIRDKQGTFPGACS